MKGLHWMHCKLVFLDEVLGSSPASKDVYKDYIASRAPDAGDVTDEIEAIGVDAVEQKGITVFPRAKDGGPAPPFHTLRQQNR